MCHAPDTCACHDAIPAGRHFYTAGGGHPVRGFSHNRGRGGGGWLCAGADWSCGRTDPLDSGPDGAARNRETLSAGSWFGRTADADAAFAAGGCDGRSRGRVALPGAGCGNCRNPGQSSGGKLHRDKAVSPSVRGDGRAVLADPAGGNRRSECRARPLADLRIALGGQPRRPPRSRRSTLADRAFPLARRTTGGMGGTP